MESIRFRAYILLIPDMVFSTILGFICISFLMTGVVYPVDRYDQQLLDSWGISSFYDSVLSTLLIGVMLITIPIYHKSLQSMLKPLSSQKDVKLSNVRNFFQITYGALGFSLGICYLFEAILKQVIYHQSIFFTSTVITFLTLYPVTGFFIGQTLTKLIDISLWEHRSRAELYWTSTGHLYKE